jgi:hypothetical protein
MKLLNVLTLIIFTILIVQRFGKVVNGAGDSIDKNQGKTINFLVDNNVQRDNLTSEFGKEIHFSSMINQNFTKEINDLLNPKNRNATLGGDYVDSLVYDIRARYLKVFSKIVFIILVLILYD